MRCCLLQCSLRAVGDLSAVLHNIAAFATLLDVVTVSSVWVQAEMSEDEGHSQGDADSDADDDGDLVSVNATCMQCKQQFECILIIIIIIAIGFLGQGC